VPLVYVTGEERRQLLRYAYIAARFGNQLLTSQYAQFTARQQIAALAEQHQVPEKELLKAWTVYRDFADELSGYVRDAVQREVQGIWKRLFKDIMAGRQTLACFRMHRALSIRGRGVTLFKDQDSAYHFTFRFGPRSGAPTQLSVYMDTLCRNPFLEALLDKLIDGTTYEITHATIRIPRTGNKLKVLLGYRKPAVAQLVHETRALVALEAGVLVVRCGSTMMTLGDRVYRLREMKLHLDGIQRRLRATLNRRSRRGEYRRQLAHAQSFEEWARTPLHQLSSEIVTWAQRAGAGQLVYMMPSTADLPWATLHQQLEYKSAEHGMRYERRETKVEKSDEP